MEESGVSRFVEVLLGCLRPWIVLTGPAGPLRELAPDEAIRFVLAADAPDTSPRPQGEAES